MRLQAWNHRSVFHRSCVKAAGETSVLLAGIWRRSFSNLFSDASFEVLKVRLFYVFFPVCQVTKVSLNYLTFIKNIHPSVFLVWIYWKNMLNKCYFQAEYILHLLLLPFQKHVWEEATKVNISISSKTGRSEAINSIIDCEDQSRGCNERKSIQF